MSSTAPEAERRERQEKSAKNVDEKEKSLGTTPYAWSYDQEDQIILDYEEDSDDFLEDPLEEQITTGVAESVTSDAEEPTRYQTASSSGSSGTTTVQKPSASRDGRVNQSRIFGQAIAQLQSYQEQHSKAEKVSEPRLTNSARRIVSEKRDVERKTSEEILTKKRDQTVQTSEKSKTSEARRAKQPVTHASARSRSREDNWERKKKQNSPRARNRESREARYVERHSRRYGAPISSRATTRYKISPIRTSSISITSKQSSISSAQVDRTASRVEGGSIKRSYEPTVPKNISSFQMRQDRETNCSAAVSHASHQSGSQTHMTFHKRSRSFEISYDEKLKTTLANLKKNEREQFLRKEMELVEKEKQSLRCEQEKIDEERLELARKRQRLTQKMSNANHGNSS